jgi:hypothetical protein
MAGLLVATPLAVSADPTSVAAQTTSAPAQQPLDAADAEHYAAREKQSPKASEFKGGSQGIYIGGGALTIVLIVLLIVIIL